MKVYTLGYQGITIQDYIRTLLDHNIRLVLDVRETPWSHKRDFSRSKFELQLQDAGIDYIHVKSAGNPSINRKTSSSTEECLAKYRDLLVADDTGAQDLVGHLVAAAEQGTYVCLTCFEKQHQECHRSILIEFMRSYIPDIDECHLQAEKAPLEQTQLALPLGVP